MIANPVNCCQLARRAFLGRTWQGVGAVALASLLRPAALEAAPAQGGLTSLPQRAKRVIWLTMAGGPSQLESFDYRPKLAEMDGKPMPESLAEGQQLAQLQGQELVCLGQQFPNSSAWGRSFLSSGMAGTRPRSARCFPTWAP
jgi:hypothetical protein